MRAPEDKFARSVRATLGGLASGHYTVDIDGRHFSNPDDVVVCVGAADIRFFLPARRLPVHH